MPPCNCQVDPYDVFTILIGPTLFLVMIRVSFRMENPLFTWAYWAFVSRFLPGGLLRALAGSVWGRYLRLFPAFVPLSVVIQLALLFGYFLLIFLAVLTKGTGFFGFVDYYIVRLGLGQFSSIFMVIALSAFGVLLALQFIAAARWFMGLLVLIVIAVYFWGTVVGAEKAALLRISNAGLSGVLCCVWLAVVDIWKWIRSLWG